MQRPGASNESSFYPKKFSTIPNKNFYTYLKKISNEKLLQVCLKEPITQSNQNFL